MKRNKVQFLNYSHKKFNNLFDKFFENVVVNVDDIEIRANRLKLLAKIRSVLYSVADFSAVNIWGLYCLFAGRYNIVIRVGMENIL